MKKKYYEWRNENCECENKYYGYYEWSSEYYEWPDELCKAYESQDRFCDDNYPGLMASLK